MVPPNRKIRPLCIIELASFLLHTLVLLRGENCGHVYNDRWLLKRLFQVCILSPTHPPSSAYFCSFSKKPGIIWLLYLHFWHMRRNIAGLGIYNYSNLPLSPLPVLVRLKLHDHWVCTILHDPWVCTIITMWVLHNPWVCTIILHDPWVCTIITMRVRPSVRGQLVKMLITDCAHSCQLIWFWIDLGFSMTDADA